jgi:hypothetical protein
VDDIIKRIQNVLLLGFTTDLSSLQIKRYNIGQSALQLDNFYLYVIASLCAKVTKQSKTGMVHCQKFTVENLQIVRLLSSIAVLMMKQSILKDRLN